MQLLNRSDIRDWKKAPNQLMVLDTGCWSFTAADRALKLMHKLIHWKGPDTIRSRRGNLALPLELWDEIFEYASEDVQELREDAIDMGPQYILVQGEVVQKRRTMTVLRCVKVEFERTVKCGHLSTPVALSSVEEFIRNPSKDPTPILSTQTQPVPHVSSFNKKKPAAEKNPASHRGDNSTDDGSDLEDNADDGVADVEHDGAPDNQQQKPVHTQTNQRVKEETTTTIGRMKATKLEGGENVFYVTLGGRFRHTNVGVGEDEVEFCPGPGDDGWEWQENDFQSLYYDVQVRDIIAHFEGGECKFCAQGDGIGRRVYPDIEGVRTEEGFNLYVGEERNPVACPVCLGVDIAEAHSEYYQYSTNSEAMAEFLEEREKELGYYDE